MGYLGRVLPAACAVGDEAALEQREGVAESRPRFPAPPATLATLATDQRSRQASVARVATVATPSDVEIQ